MFLFVFVLIQLATVGSCYLVVKKLYC